MCKTTHQKPFHRYRTVLASKICIHHMAEKTIYGQQMLKKREAATRDKKNNVTVNTVNDSYIKRTLHTRKFRPVNFTRGFLSTTLDSFN